ncbi:MULTISPECIES: L,D-transpeptidase family protein [unclassified Terrabacter]|uniref:L,D-transpeptidase family protein n=1 Tax=unclassified Terrabacter TaxID=2630222 RepID=UPI0009E6B051|nr:MULTISPECIES: L,D-transpeptidase family protein [unclassified Terrabacter]
MQTATSPLQSPPRRRTSGGQRRALLVSAAVALVAATTACGPDQGTGVAGTDVNEAVVGSSSSGTPAPTTSEQAAETTTGTPTVGSSATPSSTPTTVTPTAPAQTAKPTVEPKPTPVPVIVLRAGDTGPKVRSLQARLRQLRWFDGDVSDRYGSRTTAAVRGFQAKRGFDATGTLDERTWDKLVSMTHRPTADELANVKPKPAEPTGSMSWDVDERCLTGRVMCVSKSTRHLTWVVDGVPQYGFDVRFGSDELPTREGVFSVYLKKVDVISNLYHTPMPYSMFFSGGQAVHYSSNFARLGYTGASHGCVNVRNKPLLVQLYGEVRIGDKVVVHW